MVIPITEHTIRFSKNVHDEIVLDAAAFFALKGHWYQMNRYHSLREGWVGNLGVIFPPWSGPGLAFPRKMVNIKTS
jgi:hypothetical protein